jgi:hypothetical protein
MFNRRKLSLSQQYKNKSIPTSNLLKLEEESDLFKNSTSKVDWIEIRQMRLDDHENILRELMKKPEYQGKKDVNGYTIISLVSGIKISIAKYPQANQVQFKAEISGCKTSVWLGEDWTGLVNLIQDFHLTSPMLYRFDLCSLFATSEPFQFKELDSNIFDNHSDNFNKKRGQTGKYIGGTADEEGRYNFRGSNCKFIRCYDKKSWAISEGQQGYIDFFKEKQWNDLNVYSIEVEFRWGFLKQYLGEEWHIVLADGETRREFIDYISDLYRDELAKLTYKGERLVPKADFKCEKIKDETNEVKRKTDRTIRKALKCILNRFGNDPEQCMEILEIAMDEVGWHVILNTPQGFKNTHPESLN